MSKRVCVIDLPGLSGELLNHVPAESSLGKWIAKQRVMSLTPTWPAVTCSMQATITTGTPPSQHGIIANGIAAFRSPQDQQLIDASSFAEYRRDVSFWEQSNQLVESPRFWQGKWKTAMLFFQNSMPGFVAPLKPAADIVVTPRPDHRPDGSVNLLWTNPPDLSERLSKAYSSFPLMYYWGPGTNLEASRWIVRAANVIWREDAPTLQLVYVPHLDYDLQRFGPDSPQAHEAVAQVSQAVGPLIDTVLDGGDQIVLLSEYAMKHVERSMQPNRLLNQAGLLVTRQTPDGLLIDYQRSEAFAMCDHQIAHVYVREATMRSRVREVLQSDMTSFADEPRHRRSGDLIMQAAADAWFDYRWWRHDQPPPTFASTVDIHRKPGYDPLELIADYYRNELTSDAGMIHGSHGRVRRGEAVLVGDLPAKTDSVHATEVAGLLTELIESE